MYTSSVYCFVLWLKCRHTITVKQHQQQRWSAVGVGVGAKMPVVLPSPPHSLVHRQRREGSGCERTPFWGARAWRRGPGHTAGAARGRPTCLVSQCWWLIHPQQPPRSVQCPPAPRPTGQARPHHTSNIKWKRLLGSWVNITILARQIYISEIYFRWIYSNAA